MSRRFMCLILLDFLFFVWGCGSSPEGNIQSMAGGVASKEELLSRIKSGINEKDLEGLMELGDWDGVSDKFVKMAEEHFQVTFSLSNPSFSFQDIQDADKKPIEANGQTYKWNIDPVALLMIKDSNSDSAIGIPVGFKDGRYYFVTRYATKNP